MPFFGYMFCCMRYICRSKNIIALFFFLAFTAHGQDSTQIFDLGENIVVTASKVPTAFPNIARSISVLKQENIQALPVQSVQEIIQYMGSADLRQRGPAGVQADLSIRGSTFEQSLILIDGIRLSDPQTGHHNLNIPLTVHQVEKIELLRGPGSRLYGPNALGGVVNIITGGRHKPGMALELMAGENALYKTGLAVTLPSGDFSHRFFFEKSGSDGYRPATDFNILSGAFNTGFRQNSHQVDFSISYLDKDFGAGNFYSARYPNQWEHTKTLFMNTVYNYSGRLIHISPGLFWRKNTDDYLLDRDNPQLYHNYHETNSYGGELQTEIYSSLGISVLSAEISRENIQSTNLGDHQRDKTGLYFEQQFLTTFPVHLSLGFSSFYYSDWGWQTWPGIEISWQIFQTTTLFASYNQAFRVPTFTELYYQSPTDYGNPGLHPEESKELEIGFNSRFDRLSIASSVFRREAENLIDWLRINESEPWQAMNLTEIATDGFEIIAGYSFDQKMNPGVIRQIQTSYTWLSSDADAAGYETKYVLNYLKHQFLANIQHGLIIPDLSAGWNIRYEQRENAGDYWLVDLKMTYTIKPFLFYAEATNLFNQSYESVAAVPMPGRWIKAGFNYHFPFDMTK